MLEPFLAGAICMGYLVISLFFLRFWAQTRDRLFIYFAVAFALLLAERVVWISFEIHTEWIPAAYLFRLCAFGTIIFAVIDRNRRP